ncbi:hypothetical protein [Cyclobacterium marinum]|uniref:hypothetical protein n=1 Tax=Cyclobacterium marinum TaxID=104 RepID=UPI0002EE1DBD|nr:hypothetical protein [Cyclobacterium marinum]MBR9777567.1 hypothetical protein [Cytophagales bacterium]
MDILAGHFYSKIIDRKEVADFEAISSMHISDLRMDQKLQHQKAIDSTNLLLISQLV